MISVKKQRIVAVTVFVSIVLILFLSLNFRIWSGNYTEGDLESITIQQMDSLEKGNSEESINERICLRFGEYICLSAIGTIVFLAFEMFVGVCQGEFSFRQSVTLRSLSVRMDN